MHQRLKETRPTLSKEPGADIGGSSSDTMLTPCNLLSPREGEELEPLPGLFEWGRYEPGQYLARGYCESELECMSAQASSERVTFKVRTKRH